MHSGSAGRTELEALAFIVYEVLTGRTSAMRFARRGQAAPNAGCGMVWLECASMRFGVRAPGRCEASRTITSQRLARRLRQVFLAHGSDLSMIEGPLGTWEECHFRGEDRRGQSEAFVLALETGCHPGALPPAVLSVRRMLLHRMEEVMVRMRLSLEFRRECRVEGGARLVLSLADSVARLSADSGSEYVGRVVSMKEKLQMEIEPDGEDRSALNEIVNLRIGVGCIGLTLRQMLAIGPGCVLETSLPDPVEAILEFGGCRYARALARFTDGKLSLQITGLEFSEKTTHATQRRDTGAEYSTAGAGHAFLPPTTRST